MRTSGAVVDATRLGMHDHLCWWYTDDDDFRVRAVEFLATGLELGLRVVYVGPGGYDDLVDDLSDLRGADAEIRRGALQVVPLADYYRSGQVVIPHDQVRTYAAATEQALTDGFAGLRVAAQVTPLVRTPEQVAAFARYEHLVDRYMTAHPFSAMCGYHLAELTPVAAAELACMHPVATEGAVMFRLYGSDAADAALSGEVDRSVHEVFEAALRRIDTGPPGEPVVIDARRLDFIDHHGLTMLRDRGRDAGAEVVLRNAGPGPVRLAELLALDGITVEAA
jgi:anti-anti-sigma regulatory factor